jgi:hypothetical protein
MAGQIPPCNDDKYNPLDAWIILTKGLSNKGKITIKNYNQTSNPKIEIIYHHAMSCITLNLSKLNAEGRLGMRQIVIEKAPEIISSFDSQFSSYFEKDTDTNKEKK